MENENNEQEIMKRSQPSVEIKKDAKGQVSFTVKVYRDSPVAAAKEAKEVFADLEKKFNE